MRSSLTTALLVVSSLAIVLAEPSPPVLHLAKPTIYVDENDIFTLYNRNTVPRDISPTKTLPEPPFVTHVVIDGENIEIHAQNKELATQIIPILKDYICHSDDAVLFPKLCQDGIPHTIPGDGYSTEHIPHVKYASDENTTTARGLHNGDGSSSSTIVPVMDTTTATQPPRVAGVEERKSLPSASNPHKPGGGGGENGTLTTSPGSSSGHSSTSTSVECPHKVTVTTTIDPVYSRSSKGTKTMTTSHGFNAYHNLPIGSLDLPSTFSTYTVTIRSNASTSTASVKHSTVEAYLPGNRRLEVSNNDTSGQHSDFGGRQGIINGWEQLKKATWEQFRAYEDAMLMRLKSSKAMVIDAVKEIDNVIATFSTMMSRDGDRETQSS